ncbi:cytosine-purine permease [Pluteus cervinus]|uniref:Cytosine-purine permease n=1 Tax=Pluteus cervinus TaxID=181527 RepID=A0ACD3A8N6_9AGAR|nr:cytosine-purine permease [Pluteus cervinus]
MGNIEALNTGRAGSRHSAWNLEVKDPQRSALIDNQLDCTGIRPVPLEERTDTQYSKIFFIWFSANFNILSFSAGTLGPAIFELSFRDAALTILFFNVLCCAFPAYLTTWGPKLGLRQMIASRYSFGYYGVIVPCVLNLIGMFGFCILNAILGGQTLASVARHDLSWSVGIVIISLISLVVSFFGYEVLNWYERLAWIPVFIAFLVALGVSAKHLSIPESAGNIPTSAPAILSFASTIAGFVIAWSALSSDFTAYYHPAVSSWKIFLYSYLGLLVPIITLQCLGAAVVVAVPFVPTWETEYAGGNIGGLLHAILQPTHGFGDFLTVLLALSVAGNIAATFYSISFNLQVLIPPLVNVPRYLFSIVATAIVVPLAIVGSHSFYDTLVDFLGLLGYWSGAYVAILLVEHLMFRKNDFSLYSTDDWSTPIRLPYGFAALSAGVASFGVVVPCMNQVWYTGPIAEKTGDIGFEVAITASALLYIPFRWVELRWRGI